MTPLEDLSPTQNTGGGGQGAPAIAFAWHENQGGHLSAGGDTARAIKASASNSYQGVGVRRLTPVECERLQGFPDGWTDGQSDTQRYKVMGNAVTVNVIEWLGRRIVVTA
jgi:DNA (cytosine-5)-methyltransferase 1